MQANPDCHFLPSGDLFLRRLSRKALRVMGGRRQQLTGGVIPWRRPHKTNGAFPTRTELHCLELRGVPFGACTRSLIEHTLWPVGRLHKIVRNDIHEGDPNSICVDIKVRVGVPIPASLPVYWGGRGGGSGPEVRIAILPTPPRQRPGGDPAPPSAYADYLSL